MLNEENGFKSRIAGTLFGACAPIILSVSAGTVVYWFLLSWGLSRFRDKFNLRTILWINRVMGALVIIIGVVFIGQGLYNVIFLNKPFI